jgi:hypothetical protein
MLVRHQTSMHIAYLAVTQVRDFLIPLKEQKPNAKLRDKAVQSPVRPEIQPIEGEDLHVGHRWVFSPDKSTAHEDQSDDPTTAALHLDQNCGKAKHLTLMVLLE